MMRPTTIILLLIVFHATLVQGGEDSEVVEEVAESAAPKAVTEVAKEDVPKATEAPHSVPEKATNSSNTMDIIGKVVNEHKDLMKLPFGNSKKGPEGPVSRPEPTENVSPDEMAAKDEDVTKMTSSSNAFKYFFIATLVALF